MIVAPVAPNEADRLAALHSLKILDTEPEERFDRITRLGRRVLDVPIVLISLVDTDRQWFLSRQGLNVTETSREVSFCAHAILDQKPLIINDALEDERFEHNPLVSGKPYIRFYAGCPVTAPNGEPIGTLCAIDSQSRTISDGEIATLEDLASITESEMSSWYLAQQQQRYLNRLTETVEARTIELQKANWDLEIQIRERSQAETLLTSIFDTVDEGILAFDHTGSITLANREARKMWSYDSLKAEEWNMATLIPSLAEPRQEEEQRNIAAPVINSFLNKRVEMEGVRKDGTTFPVEISVTESRMGVVPLFTAAVRDITERKRLNNLRDLFVANISHELRTPLSAIMGYAETLQSERPGPLTQPQKHFLEIIQKSSQRLLKLIEEILLVSRIEQGTLHIALAAISPAEIIENVVSITAPVATTKEVKICVEDTWPTVKAIDGDEGRLEQVLSNLVSNAIKFSQPGSLVTIRSAADEDNWRVTVSDRGIGIPDEDLTRVFQRFFRARNSQDAATPGTGIGLHISRAIIDAHGGEIGIESTVGVGTTVWFTVPFR